MTLKELIMRQFRGHVHVDLHRYIDMYKLCLCLCLCSSSSQPKLYKIYINTLYKDIYTLYVLVQVNQIYVIVPGPPKLCKNVYT